MRPSLDGRLQRLLAILAGLDEHGPSDLDELARRHRVSRNQLEKDLHLAQFMGIPPYDLPGATPEITIEGDTVQAWIPEHFRQPPRLNRAEGFAVLTSGRAALALDPHLDALASAMDKLSAALDLGGAVEIDLDEPPFLAELRRAEAEHCRLEITYWSAWREAQSTRRVDPVRVFFAERDWYAACWDHSSDELRTFRVDRIEAIADTGERFEPYPIDVEPTAFRPPADAEKVTVLFPSEAGWVREYIDLTPVDESAATGDDVNDGSFTVELTVVGRRWLERLLLQTGGHIVAPESLSGLTAAAARRVLALYE